MKFNTSKRLLSGTAALTLTALLSTGALAQGNSDHLAAKKAKVFKGNALNSAGASKSAIGNFIGAGTSLVVDTTYAGKSGRTHMRMHQEVNGLRVHGSSVRAAIGSDGSLVHLVDRTAPTSGKPTKAGINAAAATQKAIAHNFYAGASGDFFHKAPSAEKVLIARNSGALEEGYLVETWSQSDNQLYHTLINGKGKIVSNELRTADDSYNVYVDNPNVSSQTVMTGPGAGSTQSPAGWLSGAQTTRIISGNNVSAYLDTTNNNSPDGGGTAVTDGNFLASFNTGTDPRTSSNQDVAVQNLFYLNNIIHDDLRAHGFNEAARNFQENNFGNGGVGSDSVNAEAQDGSGTNNANFSTPGDGSNPRMQMYLWTGTNPDRDGDVDSDIVWHEYGHGLTWRMIGSMSGSVSGAIGEGMGDVLGILHNGRDTIGEYSTNNSNGIRSETYTNYSRTIGDFTGNGVHFDGEIYAATIWHVSELANADGIGNEALLDIIIDGMNFTPAGPDYLDMRDGILAASPAATDCVIWQGFADFGMGEGATFNIRTNGNPRNRIQITESFTVPAACGDTPPPTGDFDLSALTGSASSSGRKRWSATATSSVQNDTGAPAANVTVGYSWSTGASGTCTTSASGSCSANIGGLRNNQVPSVTFTVQTLNGAAVTGITPTITINRP